MALFPFWLNYVNLFWLNYVNLFWLNYVRVRPPCTNPQMFRSFKVEQNHSSQALIQFGEINEDNYKDFIKSEEMLKSITFNKLDVYVSANKKAKRLLQYKLEFCCSRNGESRIDPNLSIRRKKPCLKVGKCPCRLIFRKYYDSEIMEVIYIDQHSHEIGEANSR